VALELTTVADDAATFHDAITVEQLDGLAPDTAYVHRGISFRTLARPSGTLRCRIATVNDIHLGEREAGRLDELEMGPVRRVNPGEPPYPETMSRGAVAEMATIDPAAVIVKGDLTNDGTPEEFATFDSCYRGVFGERLFVVRGNHDSYRGQQEYAGDQWIELPGVAVALLDTVLPRRANGHVTPEQLDWLDAGVAASTVPVIVMGHHQQFVSGVTRSPDYFGIDPDSADALSDVMRRRPAIIAYAAGHTHRHRVRWVDGRIPSIEVGCVKDFPGTWAEYRVYDGGVLQVVHRISTPEALAWSEQCRSLYSDFGVDYAAYAMGALEDRCFAISLR
jgi:predicted phosphodiesterase